MRVGCRKASAVGYEEDDEDGEERDEAHGKGCSLGGTA